MTLQRMDEMNSNDIGLQGFLSWVLGRVQKGKKEHEMGKDLLQE